MTSDLIGKRLLILGANPETVPLIETAKALGIYVIATDYDPKAYAKKFADKGANVDGLDVQGLVELAKREQVDGVLVGVADKLIVPYQQVCEALNLACYGTYEQCTIFTDKEKFNQLCMKYGIKPIPFFELNQNPSESELESLSYPVFIKPVDGCSGKGISICYKPTDVKPAIQKALSSSQSERFLVERCMDCDGVGIYYTFKDGHTFLSAVYDRYTSQEQNNLSRVPLGGLYPSKYVDLYLEEIHKKFSTMFRDLQIKNGVLMISAFVENGVFHVYDPGFRLQGEAPNLLIESVNGFDQKAMLVRFALTGSMGNENLHELNDCQFQGKYAATVWVLAKKGTIASICGLDAAQSDPNVVSVIQRLEPGDTITAEMAGTEAQVVARIYLVCDTREELRQKVKKLQNNINVIGIDGYSMLLNGLDTGLF